MTEIELLARFNEAEDTVFGVEPGSIHRFVFHYAEVQAIRAALAALKGAEGERDDLRALHEEDASSIAPRGGIRHSWWAIAILERRKRLAAEKSAEKAEAERDAAVAALRPFAKAGELFPPRFSEDYDQCIYSPAAGPEYSISGDDLRRARAALASNSKETTP